MADRWTIPAAALEVLGGLERDDPPVRLHAKSEEGIPGADWCEDFDTLTRWPADAVLILPQSSPALLRALVRLVGTTPHGVPRLDDLDGAGFWTLRTSHPVSFRHSAKMSLRGDPMFRVVPTLEGVTDPTRALAEIVVWLARLERLCAPEQTDDHNDIMEHYGPGNPVGNVAGLESIYSLPAWGVERA